MAKTTLPPTPEGLFEVEETATLPPTPEGLFEVEEKATDTKPTVLADWQKTVKPTTLKMPDGSTVNTVYRSQDGAFWNPYVKHPKTGSTGAWQYLGTDDKGITTFGNIAPDAPEVPTDPLALSAYASNMANRLNTQSRANVTSGVIDRGIATTAKIIDMPVKVSPFASVNEYKQALKNKESATVASDLEATKKAQELPGYGIGALVGETVPQMVASSALAPSLPGFAAPMATKATTTFVDKAGKVWQVVKGQLVEAARQAPITYTVAQGDTGDKLKETAISTAVAPVIGTAIVGGTRLAQGAVQKLAAIIGENPTSWYGKEIKALLTQEGKMDQTAKEVFEAAEKTGVTPSRTTVNEVVRAKTPEYTTAKKAVESMKSKFEKEVIRDEILDKAEIDFIIDNNLKQERVIDEVKWAKEKNLSEDEFKKLFIDNKLIENEKQYIENLMEYSDLTPDMKRFVYAEMPDYLAKKTETNTLFTARDLKADKLGVRPEFNSVNRNIDEATYSFTKDNTELGRLKLGDGKVYVESEGLGTGGHGLTDYQMEQGKKWLAEQKQKINTLKTFEDASNYRNDLKVPDKIGNLPVGANLKEALQKQIPIIKNSITSDLSTSARKVIPGKDTVFEGNIDDLISAQAKKRKKYGTPADYEAEKKAIEAAREKTVNSRSKSDVDELKRTDANAIDSLQEFKAQKEIPTALTGLKLTSNNPADILKVLQTIDIETGKQYYTKMSPTGKSLFNKLLWDDMLKKSINPRTGLFSPGNMSTQISKRMDELMSETSNLMETINKGVANKNEIRLRRGFAKAKYDMDLLEDLKAYKNVFQYVSQGNPKLEFNFDNTVTQLHGQVGELARLGKFLYTVSPEVIYKQPWGKRFLYAAKSTDPRSPAFRVLMEQYTPRLLALATSKSSPKKQEQKSQLSSNSPLLQYKEENQ